MTLLLEWKEKIRQIYGKYGNYILPGLKFALALVVFTSINMMLGYLSFLKNPLVTLILALICAAGPWNAIAWLGTVLIIGHCFGLGIEVGGFAVVLFLLIYILYLRFAPGDALALVLTPVAFGLNLPCAVPLGFGLLRKMSSAVSVSCGVVIYFFMQTVRNKVSLSQKKDEKEILQTIRTMAEGIFKDQNLMMTVIAVVVALLLVYFIRRMRMDYSWQIAVIAGGISYMILMIAGGFFFDLNNSVLALVVGTVISCLLAIGLGFFLFHVDYSRSEYFQYEDDEYYYYVKAVPKVTITKYERKVTTIQGNSEEPETPVRRQEHVIRRREEPVGPDAPDEVQKDFSEVDFESQLEESLKNL